MTAESTHKIKNAKRIVWLCVAGIVSALVVFAFVVREVSIRNQLDAQAKFDPCVSLSEAVANHNRNRIPMLTRGCKVFLNGLSPLVSLRLACAILREGGYECPKPGSEVARKGVVASSGTSPHGQPSPAAVGEKEGSKPHKKPTAKGAPERMPEPSSQPGNSGNGASAQHGLDVCVELAVSACVKSDVGLP